MKQAFQTCRIADIAEKVAMGPFGSNIKVETFVPAGVPIISGAHLKGFYVEEDSFNYITEEHAQRLKNSIVYPGDIIFTHAGTVGQAAMIPYDCHYPFYMISQRQFYLRCDKKRVIPEYLVYYFHSHEGQGKLLSNVSQVGVPSIAQPSSFLKTIEVPLPSLETQRRIVGILDSFTKKIEVNNQINRNLEEQAKAIFKSWFVDFEPFQNREFVDSELGRIPKGWRIGHFSDVISSTVCGDWGKDSPTGNYTEEVYCIRGADIPEVNAGNKGKMPLRYILPKNIKTKRLSAGDIVIEISGGSPTQSTGRSTLISDALLSRYKRVMICTNFCRAITPERGYSFWVSVLWKKFYSSSVFFQYENGTTGIKNLDLSSFIENEPIIIPPKEIAIKFEELGNSFVSTIFGNGLESEHLSTIRDTLLTKLMSGEIALSEEIISKSVEPSSVG